MPYFLTRYDVFRILQRELPADVFPDGSPSAFYHTAEMDSVGQVFESAYTNASGIYVNSFPQSCDSTAINQWEMKAFGKLGDSSLSLAQRQQLVLAKLRNKPGITKASILGVVQSTIPGVDAEIATYNCGQGDGGWVLDESQLDVETVLGYDAQSAQPVGPQLCSDTPATWGMTQADWDNLKFVAYTYQVRIYNQVLTSAQRTALDVALSAAEPARSGHVITDGLTDADRLNGTT